MGASARRKWRCDWCDRDANRISVCCVSCVTGYHTHWCNKRNAQAIPPQREMLFISDGQMDRLKDILQDVVDMNLLYDDLSIRAKALLEELP